MKVLVSGANGQLGHDLVNELSKRGHQPIGTDIAEPKDVGIEYFSMDITDETQVLDIIGKVKPEVVIHCAAWTAVDAAEADENRDKVREINADGTANIARACQANDVVMIYISTDYVFDGRGVEPWDPDCKDYAPLNWYGKTKLDGELAVSQMLDKYYIVRIAWVFGINGNNFIKTMLNVGKSHDRLTVVNDQIGTPTFTYDLARLLVDMAESDKYGYYHVTNEGGYISWYDFAVEIFKQAGELSVAGYNERTVQVVPVTTAEYGTSIATRPENSRLNRDKIREKGFTPLPDWQDAVNRYLKDFKENE